jgi:hypothetical protein
VLTSALCPPPADGQYRIAGQGTYAFCAQSCDACAGCTGFGISNNGCWLKKTTGLRALSNSVCYYNPGAFTTTPSSPPPSTAVVVYTSAGPNLDCSGTDLQTCYGCTRPLFAIAAACARADLQSALSIILVQMASTASPVRALMRSAPSPARRAAAALALVRARVVHIAACLHADACALFI